MSKAHGLILGRAERTALMACRHDGAVPVESLSDEVVAHLCPDCDEQLPATWRPGWASVYGGIIGHWTEEGGQQ